MNCKSAKARYIRSEFECFVRIGLDARARKRLQKMIEIPLITGHNIIPGCSLYLETRDSSGQLREMWYLEPDTEQMLRLLDFLRRFSVEDVRLIHSMLQR
jgi:hypothetical protein